jgi:hypothetical protein
MNIEKEKKIVLKNILKKYLPCLISESILFLVVLLWYSKRIIYYYNFTYSITDIKIKEERDVGVDRDVDRDREVDRDVEVESRYRRR